MRILVTGATHGMGRGVAGELARQGHQVVVLSRSRERCEQTVREITRQSGQDAHSYVVCDLTRLDDVRAAVDELTERFDSLDALFVNAGIGYAPEQVRTPDGMDAHFQVNYLAHFMLTLDLLPLLARSKHVGRVVFNTPTFGELDLDDLQLERDWDYERAIGQGMVAKRMFLLELHERTRARGDDRVSFIGFSIHKTVWSNQLNLIPTGMRLAASVMRLLGQFISIERCGEVMAPLFTEGAEVTRERSGQLLTWKKGAFTQVPHNAFVLDAENRQRLWEESLALCDDPRTTRHAETLGAEARAVAEPV